MPSKRGPLSKAETFYIQEHTKSGKDIHEIATDLDRPLKAIEKCVTKIQKEMSSKPLTAGEQFARRPGVTVMTENASTIGDSRKKKQSIKSVCVTEIKQKDV